MPKNVMKLLKPSPHRARNDFDLSHRHIFSANFGELLPISCIETVPGDTIQVHASDLLRTIPLVTSPFLRAKQHLDVWFVPYRDLWHNFDQFISQKSEPVSTGLKYSDYLPHTSIYDLGLCLAGNTSTVDVIGRNYVNGASKLLNLLGYGDRLQSLYTSASGDSTKTPSVNLFRLAAYNFIWYNEYRQQYYDDGSLNTTAYVGLPSVSVPAQNFNLDYLACNSEVASHVVSAQLKGMCQMRYRCWKKDLYTGLLPSTQFGAVSTVSISGLTGVDRDRWTAAGSPVVNDDDPLSLNWDGTKGNAKVTGANQLYHDHLLTGNYDVLALRKSEAVQIWRENALRAGNHIKDNMEAHYGVSSDFQDHRPTYLGSVSAPLNIGDVMTTANSSTGVNDAVGDIAGKGITSLDEKVFQYNAKEFGVIICMFSLLPETEYNGQGIDRCNQLLESEDFFIPEYENLGLEAVSSQNFYTLLNANAKVVGYAPRYFAYKTKLDKVFGSFQSQYNGSTGINAVWASPNFPAQNAMAAPSVSIPLGTLYVNPKVYDVNFSQSVDNVDQFLCDVYFDVDAVRPMSVVGLPFS